MFKLISVLLWVGVALITISFNTRFVVIQEPWKAPASADSLVNPYLIEPLTLPQGQEIYTIYCAPCHGNHGKGDGPMASNLKVNPLNFKSRKFTSQTNGALYWKIREGRGEMPSFKNLLSDEQKWQMVEYIRDISRPFAEQKNPFKVEFR